MRRSKKIKFRDPKDKIRRLKIALEEIAQYDYVREKEFCEKLAEYMDIDYHKAKIVNYY